MRIAHVSDCYLPRLGGIELQVHDLAERQAAAGHQVTVITSTGCDRPGASLDAVEVIRVGGRRAKADSIRYRHSARARSIDWTRFDVVHVHASSFSPLTFLAAHRAASLGVPTVATVHSLWARATPLFRIFDTFTKWSKWVVEWSAVSSTAAATLRGVLGEQAEVTVLPNGVTPDEWRAKPTEPKPGELRLTAVMRLSRRKRPMPLAEILLAAHRRLPPESRLNVHIAGDGPERERLERFLRRHDMTEWVHLRGRLSRAEIRTTLAHSDVFVAPAVLESFGIAALEARCAGLPIIAMAGTGVADFVGHEREGWLVDSDSSMVDAIVRIATSPDTLARVSAHNREVAPSITWTAVLGVCDRLYEAAARRQGRRLTTTGSPGALGVAALSQ
jgi:glycosyltransferase involved in cell wall biosynthesis